MVLLFVLRTIHHRIYIDIVPIDNFSGDIVNRESSRGKPL